MNTKDHQAKNFISFKDEGGFYTTKLDANGKPADDFKMYEFGTLQEITCYSKKECRDFAASKGMKANFDF